MSYRILFLCTGNSCRSQMAEGFANRHPELEAVSAGLDPHGINPDAALVMKEIGIDIANHTSDHLDLYNDHPLDVVITLCGHADETCPTFQGGIKTIHIPFDDPPKLAADAKNEEERLAPYRRVRDEISKCIAELPERLAQET